MSTISNAARHFIATCGREYEFPAGGDTPLLSSSEASLLSVLRSKDISDVEKVSALSSGLDWTDSYSVATFGIRLAILSVRTSSRDTYSVGLLALIAGCIKLDWRDTLRVLSIFENCGRRLGISIQDELAGRGAIYFNTELEPTMIAYFARPAEMRSIEVMGITEGEIDGALTFRSAGLS